MFTISIKDTTKVFSFFFRLLLQVLPELRKKFNRIILLDFIGFGLSDKPVSILLGSFILVHYGLFDILKNG